MILTSFWIPVLAMFLGLAILIAMTLKRQNAPRHARARADEILRQNQLDTVNAELSRGEITVSTATSMRKEIERAFSRSAKRYGSDVPKNGPTSIVWAMFALIAAGSVLVYLLIGVPGARDIPLALQNEYRRPAQEHAYEMLVTEGSVAPAPAVPEDMREFFDKLETALKDHPEDPILWQAEARANYMNGDFRRAYQAQQKYLELSKEDAKADDYALLAESMVLSVNGYISPEAEAAIRQTLELDPQSQVGRYYAALTMIQEGETANGRALLERLLEDVKDNDEWSAEIARRLQESAPVAGPTSQDIENAANTTEEERQAMIGSMVDGLKSRLANEGGTPEEWLRLINSLRVLGRENEALAITAEAKQKFPNNRDIQNLP